MPQGGVYDLVVVGGGIVGLATAREMAIRYPHKKIALVEKEKQLGKLLLELIWLFYVCCCFLTAMHQTGHNSGVIHAGIYYAPGSLKAKLCVQGAEMVYNYLDQKNIPYKKCGKVIVALEEDEVARLKNLYIRACANKCKDVQMITSEELKKIEPHCNVRISHTPPF